MCRVYTCISYLHSIKNIRQFFSIFHTHQIQRNISHHQVQVNISHVYLIRNSVHIVGRPRDSIFEKYIIIAHCACLILMCGSCPLICKSVLIRIHFFCGFPETYAKKRSFSNMCILQPAQCCHLPAVSRLTKIAKGLTAVLCVMLTDLTHVQRCASDATDMSERRSNCSAYCSASYLLD